MSEYTRRLEMFEAVKAFSKMIEGFTDGMTADEVNFLLLAVGGWKKALIAARDGGIKPDIKIVK